MFIVRDVIIKVLTALKILGLAKKKGILQKKEFSFNHTRFGHKADDCKSRSGTK